MSLVYHPYYSSFFSNLGRPDCRKIVNYLEDKGFSFVSPCSNFFKDELDNILKNIYSEEYLTNINYGSIFDSYITNFLKRSLLDSNKYQVAGTVKAAELALENGWAINIGGGMNRKNNIINDITITFHKLFENKINSALIIDLDINQGCGVERDISDEKLPSENITIIDCYQNTHLKDDSVKNAINITIPITPKTTDKTYIRNLLRALKNSIKLVQPDIVFYIASDNVPLSEKCIIDKDYTLMNFFVKLNIPIVMLVSENSKNIMGKSIENVYRKLELEKEIEFFDILQDENKNVSIPSRNTQSFSEVIKRTIKK